MNTHNISRLEFNTMEIVKFKHLPRAEYETIGLEILRKFDFARVKRHPQKYALGGFQVTPKDYENGFSEE